MKEKSGPAGWLSHFICNVPENKSRRKASGTHAPNYQMQKDLHTREMHTLETSRATAKLPRKTDRLTLPTFAVQRRPLIHLLQCLARSARLKNNVQKATTEWAALCCSRPDCSAVAHSDLSNLSGLPVPVLRTLRTSSLLSTPHRRGAGRGRASAATPRPSAGRGGPWYLR